MSDTSMLPHSSKRQEENQPGPSAKRPKRRESVDPEDIKPMKIINVIDDCLERVFDYLNVTELNNIAAAHPRLVTAARSVYRRKYKNQMLRIRDSGRHLSIYKSVNDSEEIVKATATSFLRNFGELVNEIQLDYENNSKYEDAHHWREVEGIIAKYCTKTLTEIVLMNCRGNVMEEIQKPFEKVKKLRISRGFTEPTKVDLNNIFPNVQNLIVVGNAFCSAECLKGKFPLLDRIQLYILESGDFVEENIQNFMQSNPHIVYLFIISKNTFNPNRMSAKFLECLSKTLTKLKLLCLENVNIKSVGFMKHIHFPNVDELYMRAVHYPNDISITFDELKYLELYNVSNIPKWNEFIIMQNKKLICLHYINKKDNNANVDDFIRLVTALPDLKTFKFASSSISPADLIQFLKACQPFQNLKTIGQVIRKDNLQNFISEMENIMDDEVKSIYKGPIKWENKTNRIIRVDSPSINFNRKSN